MITCIDISLSYQFFTLDSFSAMSAMMYARSVKRTNPRTNKNGLNRDLVFIVGPKYTTMRPWNQK